jgi:ADP-ribose pyrophosphatase YjhB (NUDIX family)
MTSNWRFIIRVYGLILNEKNQVLLSDEYQLGMKMTKFPGGGMNFGEGTIDCLKREFNEECNGQEITQIEHLYTTDFYQKAMFFENSQLISVYYTARFKTPIKFYISDKPFDFSKMENGRQSFRWVKIDDLNPDEITFPIDKFAAKYLKKKFENR